MIRDKQFIIDSIKMDLYRAVYAAGDITKALPKESIKIFLEHAYKDFDKLENITNTETNLREQIKELKIYLDNIKDPHKRLRWTEDVLTLRCRL